MPKCKCRACGEVLDTETAYAVMVNTKRSFYCNEEEYKQYKNDKRSIKKVSTTSKQQIDKDKVYWLICDIIGRKEIINTALWKERAIWRTIASDETIAQYLDTNKDYLTSAIDRIEDKEFNRIRYLSAIIKNKLGDFAQNRTTESHDTVVVIQAEHYETKFKPKQRIGLEDLEDEYCE